MALGRSIRDDFDWALFMAVSTIALFGVLNLYSATDGGATSDAYVQQLYWLVLGFGVAAVTAAIDYRYFERYGWLIPVIRDGQGREMRWPFDAEALRGFLGA